MRILHAVRSDGFAGVERHVARLARAQAARGDEVLVVGGEPTAMRASFGDAPVRHLPAVTVLDVARALRAAAPGADLVHVHMTAAEVAATLAAVGGRTTGRSAFPPVVTTRHFASARGSGRLGGLTAAVARRRVDAQIAISDYVAHHVDGQSVVVHPGVEDQPDGLSAADREQIVLMVQRLEPEKATDVGIRAFARSGLAHRGWRLEIAGDGSQRASLEALAAAHDLGDAVRFLGARSDVSELMSTAGLLLAPCPVEGLGLSVLEAMASGLPVVASAAGGHLETLGGLDPLGLYPLQVADSATAAGEQLAQLADDVGRRDAYGCAARESQRRRFTPEAQVEATDAVYREVLKHPSTRPGAPREIVVASLEVWDHVWRRNQYLVAGLLRADPGLRVLFVEPAADPLHEARRGFVPRPGRGLRRAEAIDGVGPDQLWLYEPTKILPRKIDPKVDQRLAWLIRRAARRAGLAAPVLWVNDPAAASVLTATGWPALYDVTDDWLLADRTPDELERLADDEDVLLGQCAEVTVCSEHLVRAKGAQRPVTLVTNAVDVERYRRPVPRPADLPTGPVALYLGTVHRDRFDVEALKATAQALGTDGTVVIVGPVVDLTTAEYRSLEDAGIAPLGRRDWEQVPAYLQHADVLLVPHLVNDFTDSLDPIKLYEYRAVGRPVVATPVAGFRDASDPRVTVATAADFPAAVRRVLLDVDGLRAAAAITDEDIPTWDDQVEKMAAVIERVRRPAPARPTARPSRQH